jgi:hypothetical protein
VDPDILKEHSAFIFSDPLILEDKGTIDLLKVRYHSPTSTVSHCRRLENSGTYTQWQIRHCTPAAYHVDLYVHIVFCSTLCVCVKLEGGVRQCCQCVYVHAVRCGALSCQPKCLYTESQNTC